MAHTPMFARLIDAFRVAGESATTGRPIESILEQRARDRISRREFLGAGAAAGVALTGLPDVVRRLRTITAPRVAIVGAGLAGLTCAYRLRQAGVVATVYEGNTRLGGRCWSIRGAFDGGQIAEHGGELIDQYHKETRQLAQELGLALDNLLAAEQNGTEPFYYFDGSRQTFAETIDAVKQVWQALHADVSAASYPTTYNNFTAAGFALDHMSILQWIDSRVPGGHASPLGQLLDVAYNIEYGAEIAVQSSLNLLYLLGYHGPGPVPHLRHVEREVPRPRRERPDRLPPRGGARRPDRDRLRALGHRPHERRPLCAHVRQRAHHRSVTAEQVVLALPFSKLQDVDWTKAGFVAPKTFAIMESIIGANAKVQLQFSSVTGAPWATTATATPTPAIRTPGKSPAPRAARRGSW